MDRKDAAGLEAFLMNAGVSSEEQEKWYLKSLSHIKVPSVQKIAQDHLIQLPEDTSVIKPQSKNIRL